MDALLNLWVYKFSLINDVIKVHILKLEQWGENKLG